MTDWHVQSASFTNDGALIRAVREAVFIHEQGIPAELEWDQDDYTAQHVVAITTAQVPIGTGRLLTDGRIGRMAVLATWRRHGVGTAIMQHLLNLARQQGFQQVSLSSQQSAIAFYRRLGFVPQGPGYLEVGIPHQKMYCQLV